MRDMLIKYKQDLEVTAMLNPADRMKDDDLREQELDETIIRIKHQLIG
jgi:hypothetical protein